MMNEQKELLCLTPTGGERIPETEFKPHLQDTTTANWRSSIAENERRARERALGGASS